jgi:hypothetical protein
MSSSRAARVVNTAAWIEKASSHLLERCTLIISDKGAWLSINDSRSAFTFQIASGAVSRTILRMQSYLAEAK